MSRSEDAPGSSGGAATVAPSGGKFALSVPQQDLSSDKLIKAAARTSFNNRRVPMLGGIPLLARLGQGGMGAVYYGLHPRLQQEVAIKVLPFPLLDAQPDLVRRFFREAQMAAKIKSPHLVSVTDVNEENGLFYLVMEYVSGVSAGGYLRELKKAGQTGMDEASALAVCIAATEGLAAAHAEGIIHRDIKPDNVLLPLTRDRSQYDFRAAKLADLGLGRAEDFGQSLTGSNAAVGTPGYMSPEQAMDARKARKPADVYSMGATLYALLCGHAAFTGATPMEIMFAVIQQEHTPIGQVRPDVSAATAALIDCCLAKAPEQRYVDGSALLEALRVCRQAQEQAEPSTTVRVIEQLTMLRGMPEVGKAVESSGPSGGASLAAPPRSPVPRSRAPVREPALPSQASVRQSLSAGLAPTMPSPARTQPPPAQRQAPTPPAPAPPPPAVPAQPAPVPPAAASYQPTPVPSGVGPAPRSAARTVGLLVLLLALAGGGAFGYWRWREYEFAQQLSAAVRQAQAGLKAHDEPLERAIRILTELQERNPGRSLVELSAALDLREQLNKRRDALKKRKDAFEQALAESKRLLQSDPDAARRQLELAKEVGASGADQDYPGLLADLTPSFADRENEVAAAKAAFEKAKQEAREAAQRKEFQEGHEAAKEAAARNDWSAAEKTLVKALATLSTLEHPAKAAAEGLLVRARAEKNKPADFAAKVKLGDEMLAAKKLDEARAAYEDAKRLWPDAPEIRKLDANLQIVLQALAERNYQTLMADAQRAVTAKQWTEARDLYNRVLREKANDPQATQALVAVDRAAADEAYESAMADGRAAQKDKRWTQAETAFQQALVARPRDGAAQAGIDEVQRDARKERYAEAVQQGRAALEAREWDKAENAFLRAQKELPNDDAAGRGIAAAKAGASQDRYTNAMKEGNAALEVRKWSEATAAFNLAQRERPGDVAAQKGIDRAKEGELEDQFNTALSEAKGALTRERWDEAKADFNRAAAIRPRAKEVEVGLAEAARGMHRFGLKSLNGTGGAKDPAQAAEWFRKAGELGLPEAQNDLGRLCHSGAGIPRDDAEAFKWFEKAAKQGLAAAQSSLGRLYEQGTGVQRDPAQARYWFEKAGEQGDVPAQQNLAQMHYDGRGITQDFVEAARWFKKAADQNDRQSENMLGWMYQNGRGLPKDFAEAARWFQKAAEQGFAPAQNNLGRMHEREDLGFKRNPVEAVKWYRMAAEQGDAAGQTNLGLMCLNGKGVETDYNEALALFRKAAEQGYPRGENWLAYMYDNGRGVKKDRAEAFKWWRTAAEKGDELAQLNLAMCFADGRGCQKDENEAVKWYKEAAKQGNLEAQKELRSRRIQW